MDVYTGLLNGIDSKKQTDLSLDLHLQSLKPCVRLLRKAYFGKPVVVPYEKMEIQDAYLLTYFPHYYQLIYKIFLEEVPDFFNRKESVVVSFIGGGPGSEIYGLARYIANNAKQVKVFTINLFDLNASTWSYSNDIVKTALLQNTLAKDVKIVWNSYTLDISNSSKMIGFKDQLKTSDLVVVQNCLNEIHPTLIHQTNKNIVQIYEWLGPSAMLLLSDMTSGAKNVLKAIEKLIIDQHNPVLHKTTLTNLVGGSMVSTEQFPNVQIKKNLLTGDDGLIPRKHIKYDYAIFGKAKEEAKKDLSALGFGTLYGPLDFTHLDVNDYARNKIFVGIDFGTSSTVVSAVHINNGKLEIEPIAIPQKGKNGTIKHDRLVPCVISKIDSTLMVGYYASMYKRSLTYGVDCWHSFKTNLSVLANISYPDSCLKSDPKLKIEGMKDALGVFLKYLYREVTKFLTEHFPGKHPMYALSIPVGFGSKEKQQLKSMMSAAGFSCMDVPFIEEPNAALIHYFFAKNTAFDQSKSLKTLVFDIGAGTVDLSVIEMEWQGKEIVSKLLAVHRDGKQGGSCIDNMIAEFISKTDPLLSDLSKNKFDSLAEYCEELKILMCKSINTDSKVGFSLNDIASSENKISLPDYFTVETGEKIMLGLTFKQLREIMLTYWNGSANFNGINNLLQVCLKKSSLTENAINKVIITGGGGRNPYIKNFIAKQFSADKIYVADDIQEQVARGTALHSFVVNSFGSPIITSLLNDSFYFETNGSKQLVFSKGESYPTYDKDIFFTNPKLTDSILNVFKSEKLEYNKSFVIPIPADVKQLVFFIDPDQELRCEVVTASVSFPAEEIFN